MWRGIEEIREEEATSSSSRQRRLVVDNSEQPKQELVATEVQCNILSVMDGREAAQGRRSVGCRLDVTSLRHGSAAQTDNEMESAIVQ
ncbi:hypothetical protein EYF80_023833 [Liparis tanakae]|uniref:Uncharacterized protein n=1 Tax=Liparis tanakae TaxID=230148 RepID=A0A4Z2HK37_9TELE|nr:hypothetical protein EYF80_023833 [Liparis tanakae]